MTTKYRRPRHPAVLEREAVAEHRIGIRDLKAKLSEYVREVKRGMTVVVTEHGRPVARLVPEPPSIEARLLALAEMGEIGWNGQRFTPTGPSTRVRGHRTLADLIVQERDRS